MSEVVLWAVVWLWNTIAILVLALVLETAASYRNGILDGVYNQWLPHVRKIIEADAKFPPPGCDAPRRCERPTQNAD